MMHDSKLPFHYWYIAMHLMTSTKKAFSALEMKRQLGHSRYEPVWYLMQKIRAAMGKRDGLYTLDGHVEMDEGFFESVIEKQIDPLTGKREEPKRGRGSQRQRGVLVMTATQPVKPEERKRHRPASRFRYVKMTVMENFKAPTIEAEVKASVDPGATATTDGFRGYTRLKKHLKKHISKKVPRKLAGVKLPWVHIIISNAKRTLLGIYHSIHADYYQLYLNEFCYKLNRRFFGEKLFDRLMVAGVSTTWFKFDD